MTEDILDYWTRLIKTIFPDNAWITSRFFKNDCLIDIDWKLEDDPENPNKRSKKIEIIIKSATLENYLDKDKKERELSDIRLKEFICKQYKSFSSDYEINTSQYVPKEKWLISSDVLNCSPSADTHLQRSS